MLLDTFALLPLRLEAPPAAKRKSERRRMQRERQREKQAQAAASSSSRLAIEDGDIEDGDRHGDTEEEACRHCSLLLALFGDDAPPLCVARRSSSIGAASSSRSSCVSP